MPVPPSSSACSGGGAAPAPSAAIPSGAPVVSYGGGTSTGTVVGIGAALAAMGALAYFAFGR